MLISRYRFTTSFFAILIAIHLSLPNAADAAFNEQVAINAKAIALANTVTAYPPGVMSLHYNPAGLSELPEGKTFHQSFTLPWLTKKVKFEADEDFEGFMNTWGPQEGQIHDPVAGTEDSNSSGVMFLPIYDDTVNFLIGPSAGLAYREPESRWTFAIGNYAPFAGGLNHKSDSPLRWGGRTAYIQHLIYVAPGVSFQATPTLSFGLSVGTGITAMGMRVNQRSPNELVALTKVLGDATEKLYVPIISDLTLPPPWLGGGIGPYEQLATVDAHLRDDFTPNYNLGLLWQPREWFSFGMVYQSEINSHLTGGYNFRYEENWQRMTAWNGSSPLTLITAGILDLPTTAVPYQSGQVTFNLVFPQRLQTGIMIKPTKRLRLMFDLHWADWSVWDEVRLHFDQRIQLLRTVKLLGYTEGDQDLVIRQRFEDTLHPSVALEYQLNDKIALRCGYEKRLASVQDYLFDQAANFLPEMDFYAFGVGLTLPNNHQIDISLGAMINPSKKIPNNTSENMNSTNPFIPVYNPYAGLDIEQETAIYMVSLGLTMPFADFIEQQKHLMHKQQEAIHHLIDLIKKPFSLFKKDSGPDTEAEQEDSSH